MISTGAPCTFPKNVELFEVEYVLKKIINFHATSLMHYIIVTLTFIHTTYYVFVKNIVNQKY